MLIVREYCRRFHHEKMPTGLGCLIVLLKIFQTFCSLFEVLRYVVQIQETLEQLLPRLLAAKFSKQMMQHLAGHAQVIHKTATKRFRLIEGL